MTLSGFFYGLGDLIQSTFGLLEADMVGNKFNYACIALGFVGLFIWLNKQRKFNAAAESDPNKMK